MKKKLKLFSDLLKFAKEKNGNWVADWSNPNQGKYGLYYYKVFRVQYDDDINRFVHGVSFETRESADEALEKFNNDLKIYNL